MRGSGTAGAAPQGAKGAGVASRFSAETKVADAIAADAAVIERLAGFHPAFRKLRNPVLRRVMGRLTTFADAARVASVPLATLLAVAEGRSPPASEGGQEMSAGAAEAATAEALAPPPDWLRRADADAAVRLDVRPILAAAEGEPLGVVMRAAAGVGEGGLMIIEAPFDPAPLRRVLAGKGFESYGEPLSEDHWRIWFRRTAAEPAAAAAAPPAQARDEAKIWREADGVHIDVRGLEPPGPMVAIVALIERPETGPTVIVHHEREPMFLYPELAERRWRHAIIAGEPGEVRLRLTREAAA